MPTKDKQGLAYELEREGRMWADSIEWWNKGGWQIVLADYFSRL